MRRARSLPVVRVIAAGLAAWILIAIVAPDLGTAPRQTALHNLALASSTSPADVVLPYPPEAYWPLNDRSGSTTAADLSGNGYTGTYVGATPGVPGLMPAVSDTAASFDGADDYVSVPGSSNLDPADMTVEAWVNPTSLGSTDPNDSGKWIIDKTYDSLMRVSYGSDREAPSTRKSRSQPSSACRTCSVKSAS